MKEQKSKKRHGEPRSTKAPTCRVPACIEQTDGTPDSRHLPARQKKKQPVGLLIIHHFAGVNKMIQN